MLREQAQGGAVLLPQGFEQVIRADIVALEPLRDIDGSAQEVEERSVDVPRRGKLELEGQPAVEQHKVLRRRLIIPEKACTEVHAIAQFQLKDVRLVAGLVVGNLGDYDHFG